MQNNATLEGEHMIHEVIVEGFVLQVDVPIARTTRPSRTTATAIGIASAPANLNTSCCPASPTTAPASAWTALDGTCAKPHDCTMRRSGQHSGVRLTAACSGSGGQHEPLSQRSDDDRTPDSADRHVAVPRRRVRQGDDSSQLRPRLHR
ncbi:DNA-binding transcriptional regulator [Pseudomonas syringae pv. actinidiae]|uniref:DNA-binding transcriptional regulator n=1 Tax=Pseudomonas syringae pv. actinidiae TaxID=103796 RepID=A0A2V0QFN9_PSESF|nr:DNA-binding transcriptional regulator [Pseudomonas syringae pv. actinidiae]